MIVDFHIDFQTAFRAIAAPLIRPLRFPPICSYLVLVSHLPLYNIIFSFLERSSCPPRSRKSCLTSMVIQIKTQMSIS